MKTDKNYILQNFPFLEDDFDALTDYVLFSKLYGKQIDYDLLEKKPKINGIELKGDLSLNTLGIQKLISSTDKLPSDLVTDTNQVNKFVTASDKVIWTNKQNAITNDNKLLSDLVDDTNQTNKFVTSTDISNWNSKQSAITSDSKLSADLVNDSDTTNKFVTSTDISNWNSKQAAITSDSKLSADLVNDSDTTNKFVTSTDISNWNGKQAAITSDSKLSADLVNDSDTTNKFVTSTDISNWNSKLSMTNGTWTPNIRGETTSGTATYSIQEGQYCIIGKILFYNFRIACTLTGSSGLLTIGGLPSFSGYEASVGSIESNIRSSTTDTRLYGQRLLLGNTLIGAVSDLNWSSTEYIYGTGFIMLQ